MFLPTLLTSIGLLASAVTAAPLSLSRTLSPRASGAQNVVYWGQNGGGTIENNDLSAYCSSSSGIDILVLAFLYQFGNGQTIASGTIGQSCYISPQGEPQNCEALASAIDTCRSNGVKVIISLGGYASNTPLSSQQEAQTIGQNLWDAYGNAPNGSVPRPFGSTFVDGWDFDIEHNSNNQYYQYMISTLRSNFASDSSNTYYITGAPQCPIPEPNMGEIIGSAQFDYLWVQFYNNPSCSNPNTLNFNDWVSYIANGPSANAKIFIGVPASPSAATGTGSGSQYYFEPSALSSTVSQYSSNAAFGGVMMWSAGFSDNNVNNGCTYAQQAKSILSSGSPCGGSGSSPPPPPPTTTTTPPAESSSASPPPPPAETSTPAAPSATPNPNPESTTTQGGSVVAGASCPAIGTYTCSGSSFGICDNGAWVVQACPSGTVCIQNGPGVYCDVPSSS